MVTLHRTSGEVHANNGITNADGRVIPDRSGHNPTIDIAEYHFLDVGRYTFNLFDTQAYFDTIKTCFFIRK